MIVVKTIKNAKFHKKLKLVQIKTDCRIYLFLEKNRMNRKLKNQKIKNKKMILYHLASIKIKRWKIKTTKNRLKKYDRIEICIYIIYL